MLRLPSGMTRLVIPPNPSPALITAEMWEFAQYVVALEPADFVFAGIYADKSGYHNTVNANVSRWPGEYSSRLVLDLNGVRTVARALDVKSRQAASGATPTIMAKYGARMRAAAKARDPRVQHWREVLGQFDTDRAPEAIDFQSLVERQPDSTHEWHFHWSILAMFVRLALAYEGMLSTLYGETLASWNTYARGEEMPFFDDQNAKELAYRMDALFADRPATVGGAFVGKPEGVNKTHERMNALDRSIAAVAADAKAGRVAVEAMAAMVTAAGGDFDVARVLAHMDEIAATEVERDAAMAAALAAARQENHDLRVRLAEALAAAGGSV